MIKIACDACEKTVNDDGTRQGPIGWFTITLTVSGGKKGAGSVVRQLCSRKCLEKQMKETFSLTVMETEHSPLVELHLLQRK